jgi:hypothetical protein
MKILKRVFQELDFFLLDFWDRLAKSLSNKNWSKLFHLPFNRSQSPLFAFWEVESSQHSTRESEQF